MAKNVKKGSNKSLSTEELWITKERTRQLEGPIEGEDLERIELQINKYLQKYSTTRIETETKSKLYVTKNLK